MKRGIDKKGKILEEKRTLKCTGQADEKSAHNCAHNCGIKYPKNVNQKTSGAGGQNLWSPGELGTVPESVASLLLKASGA